MLLSAPHGACGGGCTVPESRLAAAAHGAAAAAAAAPVPSSLPRPRFLSGSAPSKLCALAAVGGALRIGAGRIARLRSRQRSSRLQLRAEDPMLIPQAVPVRDERNKMVNQDGTSRYHVGKRVEILSPNGQWREGRVVEMKAEQDSPELLTVHYKGYNAQYDEMVAAGSDRLRNYGPIRDSLLNERRGNFTLDVPIGNCPGCGIQMQCDDPFQLGYCPPEKMNVTAVASMGERLRPQDEAMLLLDASGGATAGLGAANESRQCAQGRWKVLENIIFDIREEASVDAARTGESLVQHEQFDISEIVRDEQGRSFLKLSNDRGWAFDWADIRGARVQIIGPVQQPQELIDEKRRRDTVCMRCWSLWHYNDVDDIYRCGFGEPAENEITPADFKKMFIDTLDNADPSKEGLILVVDIWDFTPSLRILQMLGGYFRSREVEFELKIIINKVDLLPEETSRGRIMSWLMTRAEECGLPKLRTQDITALSCKLRDNIKSVGEMLTNRKAMDTYYIVGAANVGKSSLINRICMRQGKLSNEKASSVQDGFLVSALPGTTLQPLPMKFQPGGRDVTIIDMPGVFDAGSVIGKLVFEDMKELVPQLKEGVRFTLKMQAGESLHLGGLARMDVIDGLPFQFTCFRPKGMKVHMCKTRESRRAEQRFGGKTLTPPKTVDRFEELRSTWVQHSFSCKGAGWNNAGCDIVVSGLCWIAVTGCGKSTVDVWAPEGVDVYVREDPLMPHEARWTRVYYSGYVDWFEVQGSRRYKGDDPLRIKAYTLGKQRKELSKKGRGFEDFRW
mmetsp:Transcript_103871/g.332933  ORF Transcript_103871/g.332933 Transcript_103871/m.332933 type:complete len:790 (+) Transcript_103871:96-2465(+)